tara:strand:- start:5007 stop:5207 length:201 start_codon:yes stop_codon:yes gene_type:complete
MPFPFFVCGVIKVVASSLNFSHKLLSLCFSNFSKPVNLFSNSLGVKSSNSSGVKLSQPKATASKSS